MKMIEFELRTLTPLWTGGIDRNSNSLHEAGIVGSLRWWFEGIVRGMGMRACSVIDKANDGAAAVCSFDPKKDKKQAFEALCPVCKLFGCTGWRRQFKIDISGMDAIPLFFWSNKDVYSITGNWLWRAYGGKDTGGEKMGQSQNVSFKFGVNALWGQNAKIKIISLGSNADNIFFQVMYLLNFIQKWGALGAKNQNGFGQIALPDMALNACNIADHIIQPTSKAKNDPNHFSSSNFFSNTYQLDTIEEYLHRGRIIGDTKDYHEFQTWFIPCAFDIRYKSSAKNPHTGVGQDFGMRPWFKGKSYPKSVSDFLFGNSKPRSEGERSAGKIGVSHLFRKGPTEKYLLKIWGHVPPNPLIDLKATENNIHAFIKNMFPSARVIATYTHNRENALE